ncbi:MAG: hydrogenase small subunit [Planctomycetes bacterium]|nr:hydrogenase small subunit [Planctomycetota bacterium]
MMVTRREFLRATAAVAAALGLRATGAGGLPEALARENEDGGVPVVWLEAQSCTGCSVSVLNSIYYQSIGQLLLDGLDMDYHGALMAAAGNLAVSAAEKAYRHGDYVLVVEGSIPHGAGGQYCYLWEGMTALEGVERYARRAAFILAVGSCACYGGVVSAAPNPTEARGLAEEYDGKRVIKIPGCPTHPDWVVGTIAHLMSTGALPELDAHGRPTDFFGQLIHGESCPRFHLPKDSTLGGTGCLMNLGCKGPDAHSDCPSRRWNSPAAGEPGVNWCVGAGTPCIGCTDPSFPDGMSPFYSLDK